MGCREGSSRCLLARETRAPLGAVHVAIIAVVSPSSYSVCRLLDGGMIAAPGPGEAWLWELWGECRWGLRSRAEEQGKATESGRQSSVE